MTKNEIMQGLHEDQKEKNGEILSVNEKEAYYFSYDDYSFPEYCRFTFSEAINDKFIKSLIIIGNEAKKSGITEEFCLMVLKSAYKDDLADAVCTLKYIPIFYGKRDFTSVMKTVAKREWESAYSNYSKCEVYPTATSVYEEMIEEFDYPEDGEWIGKKWHQLCASFVNAGSIYKEAKSFADKFASIEEEYKIGIASTLIHEVRHEMLDCNFLLPEDKYPTNLASEEEVEDFCREKTDCLLYCLGK
jgi:hypothetical protein